MSHRTLVGMSVFLGLLFWVFGVFTLPAYGIDWDEPTHFMRGQSILQFFLTGRRDYANKPAFTKQYQKDDTIFLDPLNVKKESINGRSEYEVSKLGFTYWADFVGHPPLSGILASVSNRIFFQSLKLLNDIDSYHLYTVTLSAVLVGVLVFWVGTHAGIIAGIFSGVTLAIYPMFWAESHFNVKDPPEAVWYAFAVISFYEAIVRKNKLLMIGSAVLAGCALATKFNFVFAVFILAVWMLMFAGRNKKHWMILRSFVPVFFLYPIIMGAILFISWPYLWPSPIPRLMDIVGYYSGIGLNPHFNERYLSMFGINTYAIQWILYTTPVIVLVLFFLGGLRTFAERNPEKKWFLYLLLFWVLLPILRVTMPNAGIYGGTRQIMEYVPPMAALAGIGASWFIGTVLRRIGKRNTVVGSITGIALLSVFYVPTISRLIALHPHETLYFNELIGGLKGAKEAQIPDWGQSLGNPYKEALQWMNAHAVPNSRLALATGIGSDVPDIFFRTDILFSNVFRSYWKQKGEYIIGLTHDTGDQSLVGNRYLATVLKPLYVRSVDTVPIYAIWKNDPEHVKEEYRHSQTRSVSGIAGDDRSIVFDIGGQVKLKEIAISLRNTDCVMKPSGTLSISKDGVEWMSIDGDLFRQMLFYEITVDKAGVFHYYFVADEARYIQIQPDENSVCFGNTRSSEVTYFP